MEHEAPIAALEDSRPAVEVLDGNNAGSARDGIRRAILPGSAQESVQPGANRRSGTGSPDYRSLAENKPRSVTRALMFPTFGRGERKGQAVPRWGKNSPVGSASRQQVGDPGSPHHVSSHETDAGNEPAAPRDAQGCPRGMRHASIKTTGDVYVQTIEQSVLNAINSRTRRSSRSGNPPFLMGR